MVKLVQRLETKCLLEIIVEVRRETAMTAEVRETNSGRKVASRAIMARNTQDPRIQTQRAQPRRAMLTSPTRPSYAA